MAIKRSTLMTGPAVVSYNGTVIYFRDGLKIVESLETFDVMVDILGTADQRIKDKKVTISGKPAGEWRDLATLFPWLNAQIGTRIHGSVDVPLTVQALDGTSYTYHNTALTKMPNLTLKADDTMLGDIEFTARVKDNTEPEAPNSIFIRGTSTFSDVSLQIARIKTQRCKASWGSWADFATEDGFQIDFDVQTQDLTVDGYGVLDQMIKDVKVTAKFKPLGVTQAEIDAKLKLQGDILAAQGASLNARGERLTLTGKDVCIVIYSAAAKSAPQELSMSKLRNGEMEVVATRSFIGNVANPLAYVGTVAPV